MIKYKTLCMLAIVFVCVVMTGCGKDAVSTARTQTETMTKAETQTQTETMAKAETQTQTETMAKAETQTQSETMAKTETQTQSETQANVETQAQPETQVNVETQPQSETMDKTQAKDESVEMPTKKEEKIVDKIYLTVNGRKIGVTLAKNSSVDALVSHLKNAPITYQAHDYGGFEKVGDLGISLPRNDENITTKAGDVILYQGTNLCIYYNQNNWDFTRIGWVDGLSGSELKNVLGSGNVTVTVSLE